MRFDEKVALRRIYERLGDVKAKGATLRALHAVYEELEQILVDAVPEHSQPREAR